MNHYQIFDDLHYSLDQNNIEYQEKWFEDYDEQVYQSKKYQLMGYKVKDKAKHKIIDEKGIC
jgi:hypothetical protein